MVAETEDQGSVPVRQDLGDDGDGRQLRGHRRPLHRPVRGHGHLHALRRTAEADRDLVVRARLAAFLAADVYFARSAATPATKGYPT